MDKTKYHIRKCCDQNKALFVPVEEKLGEAGHTLLRPTIKSSNRGMKIKRKW